MPLQDLTPQLRTRLRHVEKVVGLFVAVATLLLLAGFAYYIYHTADRKGWFVEKCPYFTYVQSADGLNVADPIELMGFSVGKITTIEAQPPGSYYHVFVGFEVRKPYYGYIWSNSKVRIAAAGFLGQRQLEVTTGTEGDPTAYEKNGRVVEILYGGKRVPLAKGSKGVFILPDEQPALTERAEKLVAQVEQALPSILSLTNRLNAVLDNTAQLTSNANHLVVGAQPIVTNLAEITTNLRNPKGSLGEWIIPTNMQSQLGATFGNVNTNLLSLNATLLNLASITSNLNTQVQGSDQILGELSHLVIEADDLIQGLKRHWLLKGAFPQSGTNAPQPLLEPETK
ncbi:MAG: MCE family protein [Verrucomicrobiae bacterium]|nr:MCE family protein [Verrucomicrobiae bacterium]